MVIKIRTVVDWVGVGSGGGGEWVGISYKQHKGLPGIMEMFHISNEVVFSWAYTFEKIHHCIFL